jgi:HEAT repeat protein
MLTRANSHSSPGHSSLLRVLRHLATGLSAVLLLTICEALVWISNPGQLFGRTSHSLVAFLLLPQRTPLLLFVPLVELAGGCWLSWLVAQPLAVLAYLKTMQRAQQEYRARYTALPAWSYLYDLPLQYASDNPDPTRPRQTRTLGSSELIALVTAAGGPHLLLLGEVGAGKTTFLHECLATVAQRRWQVASGRLRLPLCLSLRYYALLGQTFSQAGLSDFSLLDFLANGDFPGLGRLAPYLGKLLRQGRLLLLCDDLDEVPEDSRATLVQELTLLWRQNRNALLLTCTPGVYERAQSLIEAAGENLIPRALLEPLDSRHRRPIIERFLTEKDARSHTNLPTAGQVMTVIERTRLRSLCTTPLYLFALLELVEGFSIEEIKGLDTRGRLLCTFLKRKQQLASLPGSAQAEDLLFLRDLACLARWNDGALVLPAESVLALGVAVRGGDGDQRLIRQALGQWAREQVVPFPFAAQGGSTLVETFPPEQAIEILQRAHGTALLEIGARGVVEFRHTLFASALLAEHLASFLGAAALHMEEVATFPEDFVAWCEPFALWAGLLDYPLEAVGLLATWAREHPEQTVHGLLAALICLGVAQPDDSAGGRLLAAPPALVETLGNLLDDQQALAELATLFLLCAEQGVPELYQALFPLLLLPGSEVFLGLLDPALVGDRFFQRLIACIDDPEEELLVKRLVRALSAWGEAVVPRAASLCAAGSGGRLRTAAINILGGTREPGAVEPLLLCLRDANDFIARRAANALVRLGPDLTLPSLLQTMRMQVTVGAGRSLPPLVLPIIERFLNDPACPIQHAHLERTIDLLMELLHTSTVPADIEQVRTILVSQGRLAAERASGKLAIRMLVEHLATADETVARTMSGTLKEVGLLATPHLLEQLEGQAPEAERVRILEVLASIRDERALPALLRLLADHSLAVQQALANTLVAYQPASIAGLIEVVLGHREEAVAIRAEQVLGCLDGRVVEPVSEALTPLIHGRTPLLVHVLEQVGDARAVPALIALLADSHDLALVLAVVQALGRFSDERAVRPLIDVLGESNPLLYEGAINALSNLGELVCAELIPRLASAEKTLVVRIERVFLGMQPFPGEHLLQVLGVGNQAQLAALADIFLAKGSEAAQLLATNLFHREPVIREQIRQLLSRMDGRYAVPALLEVLSRPDPAWRELIASYLLAHPQEAIPPLVGLLGDPERGDAVVPILLQAGRPVLSALISALDATQGIVQTRASALLVNLVQRQEELLTDVVQLFGLAPPQRARETLMCLLTQELAMLSLPALLAGLEDAHLLPDVSATLVRLAQRSPAQGSAVLENLLHALRVKTRRHGAILTLIDVGEAAVPGVGALITDPDPDVARSARRILGEIGTPAFAFLWAAHSDASNPVRQEAARGVFRAMPTRVIKDELVALLTGARSEDISMALSLLLERVHDESLQPGRVSEMLPALLEYVQSSSDERASLRILALFILLGGPVVGQVLLDALHTSDQGHAHLIQTFLLLGQGVETDLLGVLRDAEAPVQLQADVAGILAMRVPTRDVLERALSLNEHGLWAGRSAHNVTTVLQPAQLDIALHALGGLLVAGHWHAGELQNRRAASKEGSAEHELYSVLLGWRYNPQMTRLRHDLELEHDERKQDLFAHTQEILGMKAQQIDLEHDLNRLRQEHEEQRRSHEEKSKELQKALADLNSEKQALQIDLRKALQEKQALAGNSEQAAREKERLRAEAQRWQTYSQQLERDLTALRRPKPNA